MKWNLYLGDNRSQAADLSPSQRLWTPVFQFGREKELTLTTRGSARGRPGDVAVGR